MRFLISNCIIRYIKNKEDESIINKKKFNCAHFRYHYLPRMQELALREHRDSKAVNTTLTFQSSNNNNQGIVKLDKFLL